MATVAMLAMSIGVYSVATSSPALAALPDLTAPERVYTPISQEIAFTNVVDPISDDNRTIAVTVTPGPVCHTDPNDASFSITGCARVQMDLSANGSGLLFIPGSTTATTQYTNNTKVIVAASGAIIDQATDPDGGPSLVYHISGDENQINDTLSALKFQPTPGYETLAIQPTILHIVAINGSDAANVSKDVEIKVEGGNGAPTISVPGAPVDAPAGSGMPNDSGTAFPADPSNPMTPPLATVVDPEMCNLTICGQPYTNPGGVEDDDAMLLVAWVDPNCGEFHFRGGSFPVHGGVLNTTVLALLTNIDTGQNPGLNLAGEQAAPILDAIGLQAQTVDLQLQPSDVTSFTTAFAGVGTLSDVRYTLSQITYRGPTTDGDCPLHLAVSDLGNSGMPAPHGYVGSPIGGADQPQPGYEIPDAKADVQDIVFHVQGHPDVTIEQTKAGAAGDPTNQPAEFTATFTSAIESLQASDLTITGLGSGSVMISPSGSASSYDIQVTPSPDSTVTVSLAAGKVYAAGHQGEAARSNNASTSNDNSVVYDSTKPDATLSASANQSGSPVVMTVDFTEAVNAAGFSGADVSVASDALDSLTAFVTPVTATSFQISVTGMVTTNSHITATVSAGAVTDLAGNDNNASNMVSVTWTSGGAPDIVPPTVTVEQAGSDPTNASPIPFTATFSEPVLGFSASDVVLSGAGAVGATASISGAGPVYTINVSGMTQSGVVTASINAGAVVDLSGNPNLASTSVDNSVLYNKPGVATHFTVSAPPAAQRNTPFTVVVTALDASNATATGYSGTVHFTSTDGTALLPANATLVNGTKSFSVTLKNAADGNYTVTATDTVTAAITGTSANIALSAAAPAVADHFSVTANPTTVAGASLSVTVTALTAANATDTTYAGTVHFTSSDFAAVLPADSTLVNGVKTFAVTLKTAGSRSIAVTDTVLASITGSVAGGVSVTPAAATHFTTSAPPSTASGVPFNVTVTAKDAYNNTATAYAGTVHFTSSDGAATLPANSALVNGTKSFSVTLITAGSKTVTATDTITPSITGFSTVSVSAPGAATHFSVTTSGSTTAGSSISVTVTALTASNAPATTYVGTVHLTSSDGQAVLPANSTLVNGTKTFSVTLRTAGNQTVTATDTVTGSITGVSGVIIVAGAAATHFGVSAAAAATAGAPVSVIVTALDQFGNRDTGYPGTVHLTSSDPAAVLPANNTLVNGISTFPVTLNTLGNATVTATDTVNNAITGTSGAINVTTAPPAAATHFSVSAPASATAGSAFSVTVTALTAANATASGYSGTVHFTSTSAGTLPADVALVNGVGVVSATLTASGNQTISATDTVTPGISGTSAAIDVAAAAAAKLQLSIPQLIQVTTFNSVTRQVEVVGSKYTFTVTALDTYGNVATSYAGIVHFASDDPTAILPPDSPLVNGVGTFTATFNRTGTNNLSVTDLNNPNIAGAIVGGVVVAPTPTPSTPDPGAELPATGSNSVPSLWIASLLIASGMAVLAVRARRRRGVASR